MYLYVANFDERNTFDLTDMFFVNFSKNASKQQKSYELMYVAQFDEKHIF